MTIKTAKVDKSGFIELNDTQQSFWCYSLNLHFSLPAGGRRLELFVTFYFVSAAGWLIAPLWLSIWCVLCETIKSASALTCAKVTRPASKLELSVTMSDWNHWKSIFFERSSRGPHSSRLETRTTLTVIELDHPHDDWTKYCLTECWVSSFE